MVSRDRMFRKPRGFWDATMAAYSVRYVMRVSSTYSTMCSIDLPRISWTACRSSAQRSQSKVSIASSLSVSCLDLFKIVQNLFFYPHHLEGYVENERDYYLVKIFASTNSLDQQGY